MFLRQRYDSYLIRTTYIRNGRQVTEDRQVMATDPDDARGVLGEMLGTRLIVAGTPRREH